MTFHSRDTTSQRQRGLIGVRSFLGATGGSEHFLALTGPAELDAAGQLRFLERRYAEVLGELGLAPETAVFRRLFLSDMMNQAALVQASGLFPTVPDNPVAVSVVQQAPLQGAKVAMLAYHVSGGAPYAKRQLSPKHLVMERNGLHHLWSTRLCAGEYGSSAAVVPQTRKLFDDLTGVLSSQGGNLRDHCVRTWLYLKNVDVFYQGMVDSRIEVFNRQGLTRDTHYIASTGIEGACAHRYDLVSMDAYSILGMKPEQMSFLNDFSLLCPTHDYNVTFERGTRIAYADRAHHFISGTASIDEAGRVLFPGDVVRQLERALVNVDALLRSGASSIDDMMYLIVYLRDPADYPKIDRYLGQQFPTLPLVIVQGAVCRPEWLVEVEGIAVAPHHQPALPEF